MASAEVKLLFTGPPGVGKTTAIAAISDSAPVNTDVAATDDLARVKEKTTVAMDYATLTLDDGSQLGLYGTPGQERFEFMWKILAQGALGLVILVDASAVDSAKQLEYYLDAFVDPANKICMIVGINKAEPGEDLSRFDNVITAKGIVIPTMAVDVRQQDDVRLLVDVLLSTIEFSSP